MFIDRLQVVLEDGTYPGGRLTVQPLPEQVHGKGTLRTLSLRRIQGIPSEADAQDHIERELLKVPLSESAILLPVTSISFSYFWSQDQSCSKQQPTKFRVFPPLVAAQQAVLVWCPDLLLPWGQGFGSSYQTRSLWKQAADLVCNLI